MSRQSGVTTGLDGAIQRLVVNGNSVEHVMEHATDSGGKCIKNWSSRKIDSQRLF